MDVRRREASIEQRRKHFLMNNFEVTEPILNSPFRESKAHWWIAEGGTPQRRVNTANAEGSFGVGEFAIAENVADAGGLISAA